LNLIFLCLLNIKTPRTLNYDETIITHISRQPVKQLSNTIQAEPHPPGYYLFLSLLPTADIFATRLINTIVSHFIFFIGLIIAYKTRVVQKFNLTWGFCFIFAAFGFHDLTAL